jgi:hypothetical protein
MTDTPEFIPVTEEQRRESEKRLARTRELALEAMKLPPLPVRSPGKFTDPMGILADGTREPPLTPEEAAHNEEVRRKGREEARRAREQANRDER